MKLRVVTRPNDHGIRVDKYLTTRLPTFSRTKIQKLLLSRCILLNNSLLTNRNYRIKENEEYEISLIQEQENTIAADLPLNIIYEDENLLVLNKDSGITVHPGIGNKCNTLVNALVKRFSERNLSRGSDVSRPGIVHRLDKDTTGLMVVAKNDFTHYGLAKQLAARTLSRKYLAVVWGVFAIPSGKIIQNIARHNKERHKMTVVACGGKEAITTYITKKTYNNRASLLECTLHTGRTHQIRVHMQYKSHAVIGDKTYSRKHTNLITRQALHAYKLAFIHPVTREFMQFITPLPQDMNNLIMSLQNDY